MGLLKNVAILVSIASVAYSIRWHFIGRLYRTSRKLETQFLVVITGATSGIGLATAKEIAKRNSHLVLGCRKLIAGEKIKQQLKESIGTDILVDIFELDLGCLKSVVSFVEQVNNLGKPIYALVNNAGIFYTPPEATADGSGLERTFQVNYLAHYLLTIRLLYRLKQCPNSRVVNVVSQAHRGIQCFPDLQFHRPYDDSSANRFQSYSYSKFCLVLFAYKLSSILSGVTDISVHCIDPGNVETSIFKHLPSLSNRLLFCLQKPIRLLVIKSPHEGAQGILYAILEESRPRFYISNFWSNLEETTEINPRVYNPILGETLWTMSRQMCREHLLELS
ncbi:retinol dehydrogenase 12-like [Uranotaenia lowii]|uniref:retinol dehydrogenase 12-like n=1 Tax=Uranotaenia lowii TaxID=190385 RepID=UPI00247A0F53|nr:retinol dehydrogenase 12-like [Uranotaenia lowii]